MIILNVSGYKTGGTWLQNILNVGTSGFKLIRNSRDIKNIDINLKHFDLPEKFGNADNLAKLNQSISLASITTQDNILDKLHIFSCEDELVKRLSETDIHFFLMQRDYKDVVVSRYYHEIASNRFSGDFASFFTSMGKKVLIEAFNYNEFWLKVKRVTPHFLDIEYSELKNSYAEETKRIQAFLGDNIFDCGKVKHLNSINVNREFHTDPWMTTFKEKGGDFYRKGIVGDFETHFTPIHLDMFKLWIRELSNNN